MINPNQADVSESLIRRRGGEFAPQRKLAIICILDDKKSYQGTLETQELTPKVSMISFDPLLDLTGSFKRTLWYSRICQPVFTFSAKYIILTLWETFWSLWYITRAQGTLLDLRWHPNGPLNGPCEADSRGPLVKKGTQGSFRGPDWPFFLHKPFDYRQT